MNAFWYFGIGVSACISALSLFVYVYLRRKKQPLAANKPRFSIAPALLDPEPRSLIIGVLTPLANEAAHYLVEGLCELLARSGRTRYTVLPLNGNNTRVSLFECAQRAAQTCDLLVTFGVTCGNIASEAAHELKHVPIIKAGLRTQQINKLILHGPNTVVVTSEPDFDQQISLLATIKPTLREACILYRLHQEQTKHEVKALRSSLERIGIKAQSHILAANGHIDHQLSALSRSFDTLFLMPYTVTATSLQELVAFCMAKGITLCSQELDVVTLGAAIGFGQSEKDLGIFVGHIVRNICEGKKLYASGTTMSHYPTYTCLLNRKKCHAQGINISPEYLTMLEQAHIINTQQPFKQATNNEHTLGRHRASV